MLVHIERTEKGNSLSSLLVLLTLDLIVQEDTQSPSDGKQWFQIQWLFIVVSEYNCLDKGRRAPFYASIFLFSIVYITAPNCCTYCVQGLNYMMYQRFGTG